MIRRIRAHGEGQREVCFRQPLVGVEGQGRGDRAAWPAFWEGLAGVKGLRGGVQEIGQAGARVRICAQYG